VEGAKVRERRRREAGANVGARKPQEAESQERRGRRSSAFTGGGRAGAGLDSGAKAWEPSGTGWRLMRGFGRGRPCGERHAGAGWSRGEPTRSEEQASEGTNPEGASPVKQTGEAGRGAKRQEVEKTWRRRYAGRGNPRGSSSLRPAASAEGKQTSGEGAGRPRCFGRRSGSGLAAMPVL
jgi:hypothetical protein